MKISVDNSLTEIKINLRKEGYEVYDFSDRVISDIYIYSEDTMGTRNIYNSLTPDTNGSLIINANGKTFNEIKYSIDRRLYTPLFS